MSADSGRNDGNGSDAPGSSTDPVGPPPPPDVAPAATSRVPPPLLESLAADTLDPGYERAARRRKAGAAVPTSGATRGWLSVGAVVVGLLIAVAFQTNKANSAGVTLARQGLISDIERAQEEGAALAASVSAVNAEVRSAQAAGAPGGPLSTLTALEQANALVAVTGPGLVIRLDDPDASSGNGAVLDKDLQLLVNGLWSAGAEAIAINDVRLRVTSAIRQAGGAILVDNRVVLWPMTVQAIADPDSVQQQFVSTPGFGRFRSFEQLYGVTFDVKPATSVTLPAAPAVDFRYIETPSQASTGTAEASTGTAEASTGTAEASIDTEPTPTS